MEEIKNLPDLIPEELFNKINLIQNNIDIKNQSSTQNTLLNLSIDDIIEKKRKTVSIESDYINNDSNKNSERERCRYGNECFNLKKYRECKYAHPISELPCFIEYNYNVCDRYNCKFKHMNQNTNKRGKFQHKEVEEILDKNKNVKYITTNTNKAKNIDLGDQMVKLSNRRIKALLEKPIKCIEYENTYLFMYKEKLYKELYDLSEQLL